MSSHVITQFFEDNTLVGFTACINGAIFTVHRVKKHDGTYTKRFHFNNYIETTKDGRSVEIDWDTSSSDMMNIADELNLKYIQASSVFSLGAKKSAFEVVE